MGENGVAIGRPGLIAIESKVIPGFFALNG
jgi:hypothetical protein